MTRAKLPSAHNVALITLIAAGSVKVTSVDEGNSVFMRSLATGLVTISEAPNPNFNPGNDLYSVLSVIKRLGQLITSK